MSLSFWKTKIVDNQILKNYKKKNKVKINLNKTFSRRTTIIPNFINSYIYVYNGKKFKQTKITKKMLKQKLGEFHYTRGFLQIKKKK